MQTVFSKAVLRKALLLSQESPTLCLLVNICSPRKSSLGIFLASLADPRREYSHGFPLGTNVTLSSSLCSLQQMQWEDDQNQGFLFSPFFFFFLVLDCLPVCCVSANHNLLGFLYGSLFPLSISSTTVGVHCKW